MMALLIVALMMAALSTEVYTAYYSEDQKILKALKDLSHASIPPSAKSSGNFPVDEVHSAEGKFPRTVWWMSKVVLPQTIRKRQDVSSFNLNSFGLRYGK
ncbi:metastasis-suppressor KiSS-1 [Anarhichas minor]|uniref:metastasis-suppressor KiSS-1 n=1 Tax=Anarhichas minor TaxID=65739 RepID=UPI003F740EE5